MPLGYHHPWWSISMQASQRAGTSRDAANLTAIARKRRLCSPPQSKPLWAGTEERMHASLAARNTRVRGPLNEPVAAGNADAGPRDVAGENGPSLNAPLRRCSLAPAWRGSGDLAFGFSGAPPARVFSADEDKRGDGLYQTDLSYNNV